MRTRPRTLLSALCPLLLLMPAGPASVRAPPSSCAHGLAWVLHDGLVMRQTATEERLLAVRLGDGPVESEGKASPGVARGEDCLGSNSSIRLLVDEEQVGPRAGTAPYWEAAPKCMPARASASHAVLAAFVMWAAM